MNIEVARPVMNRNNKENRDSSDSNESHEGSPSDSDLQSFLFSTSRDNCDEDFFSFLPVEVTRTNSFPNIPGMEENRGLERGIDLLYLPRQQYNSAIQSIFRESDIDNYDDDSNNNNISMNNAKNMMMMPQPPSLKKPIND